MKKAYMVDCFADLWFWLVLEVRPLGPVERDGASCLVKEMRKHSKPGLLMLIISCSSLL